MKIKFQVSQLTNIDPQVIKGLIQLKLKDEDYKALEVTDKSIRFYDNPWVFRWNFQQVGRLSGGTFNIDVSDNGTSVSLHFYLNLFPPLIALSIPLIGSIIEGFYEGTVFVIIFFIVAMFVDTFISKNSAKNMLTAILNEDIMN